MGGMDHAQTKAHTTPPQTGRQSGKTDREREGEGERDKDSNQLGIVADTKTHNSL